MTDIVVQRLGAVTRVVLNRPDAMNAVTPAMHDDLQIIFDDFAADPAQRICIVTGAGDRAFCAGSDLKAMSAPDHVHRPYPRNGYAGLIERFDLNKPVIAAVNGLALGGGFEIALACDIIVAVEDAQFGLPEPLVGAIAVGGGLHRLVRQIGEKRAMGMILSCRRVGAAEALAMGLVNQVVPAAELEDALARWCDDMLRAAPLALQASKEAAMRGLGEASLADAIRNQHSYPAYRSWHASEDLLEGPRAFAEKRQPQWRGR